jgi:hypothetical protein
VLDSIDGIDSGTGEIRDSNQPSFGREAQMPSENESPRKFKDGKHIKAARTIAGLTRSELAEAADLHPNSVKYWELDKSRLAPDGWAIDQISMALASFGVDTEVEVRGDYKVAIVRRR